MKLLTLYSQILVEGKFPITDDMKRVASEYASKASNIDIDTDTNSYLISKVEDIYERNIVEVDGGKYGKKKIHFFLAKDNNFAADAYTAIIKNNNGGFTFNSKAIVVYIKQNLTYDDYYYNIIHELIHAFDPKLSNYDLTRKLKKSSKSMTSKGTYSYPDYFKYINSPHELDAFISTTADRLIDYLSKTKKSIQGVASFIRHMDEKLIRTLPKNFNVLIYFKRKPTSWKRFINALQRSYDDLKASSKLKDDKSASRNDESIDVFISKQTGKFYYKVPKYNYISKYFDNRDDLRDHAKKILDALYDW